jgi:hypothetical protein
MLNPDRYTKIVLTIIAAALVWLCIRHIVPVAQASESEQVVSLAGIDQRHPLPVKIVSIEYVTWTEKAGPFDTVQAHLPWDSINVTSR